MYFGLTRTRRDAKGAIVAMQMEWPQKLFGVSEHLKNLKSGTWNGLPIEPSQISLDEKAIAKDPVFSSFVKHMSYTSQEYRAKLGKGEFPHRHKFSGVEIKRGAVEKSTGFIFSETESVWSCKLPDRAAFIKWSKCETKTAHRDMQKFVMFYLAREGAQASNYIIYPFDEFVDIDDPQTLCDFLNKLMTN